MLSAVLLGAVSAGCSDVHMRAYQAPFGRQHGRMVRLQAPPLQPGDIVEAIRASAQRELPASKAFEYSFDHGSAFRVRCHAFVDSDGWALAMRIVPAAIPSFQELRLPPVVKALAQARPGLTLVTGPMGNGKSTTMAAILGHMAHSEALHIVTLEDPIEYRLQSESSCVSQREVGRDAPDLRTALRDALREDPDVLFIGELRDINDLEIALHASDMGIAVYATFHTHGAVATLLRLVSMHPVDAQATIRERVADSLRGCLSQRLVPKKGSHGRVLATEVLVNNYAVKECLRDPQRMKQVPQILERSSDQGMHTFDQALLSLVAAGLVDVEQAASFASSPGNLKRALHLAGVQAA